MFNVQHWTTWSKHAAYKWPSFSRHQQQLPCCPSQSMFSQLHSIHFTLSEHLIDLPFLWHLWDCIRSIENSQGSSNQVLECRASARIHGMSSFLCNDNCAAHVTQVCLFLIFFVFYSSLSLSFPFPSPKQELKWACNVAGLWAATNLCPLLSFLKSLLFLPLPLAKSCKHAVNVRRHTTMT